MRFLPNPHTDNIEYVIKNAAGNSEKLTDIHKILRAKLVYMSIEKQKGSWWFSDDGLPKFIEIIEDSGMTEIEKKMLLSQDLFVQKMKDGGDDLEESYGKYYKISQEIKGFQNAMKTSSKRVKDQVKQKFDTKIEAPQK